MFGRRRTDDDFSEEIQAHLQIETDRLIAHGLTPDAARAEARRAFGNVTLAREQFHEQNRWRWLEQLVQDFRYGWRSLLRSPVFLATAVLTLAVGMGLVTVAFTVFNAYVLRPFAVRDPASLRGLAWHSRDAGGQTFRWRDYEELQRRPELFRAVAAESTRFVSSNGRPLAVALVSGNYFEVLGPRIRLGRGLGDVDSQRDAAVLSDQGWTRLFRRDPAVLGRGLDINGHPFTIVGVAAAGFGGLNDMPRDAWLPFTAYAAVDEPALTGPRQPAAVGIVVRLREGVSPAMAATALRGFMREAVGVTGELLADLPPRASPNPLSLQMLAVLSPVFAAFGLVLVTACANVSSLMLARAIARHREVAVRLAIGASRGRIVRQLLTEGLLIASMSGLVAIGLAWWTLRAAVAAVTGTLPPSVGDLIRVAPIGIDYRVFVFALLAACAATLMFGLVPALEASRLALTDALRGQGGNVRAGARLRALLVTAQVVVSVVLVVVALTLARNGSSLGALDLGYNTTAVTSVNVREEQTHLVRRLAAALAADPQLGQVAVTNGNPLFIRSRPVAAAPVSAATALPTRYTYVSPEYFDVLRIPVLRGRLFSEAEARNEARVALVSAATAHAFWPDADPLGQTIRIERPNGRPTDDLPGYAIVTVVGVVDDVVSGFVMDGRDSGHIYLPTNADSPHAEAILLRGRAASPLSSSTLQGVFSRVATDPEAFEALPLEELRELQLYPLRLAGWIGAVLGLIALALSMAGLYGVLACTLSQRTREIGIRMALGATPGAVVRLIMRHYATLAGAGVAIGFTVALAAMFALRSVVTLREVTTIDAAAFVGGVLVVLGATALASYAPARRATRVDPSRTLRAD